MLLNSAMSMALAIALFGTAAAQADNFTGGYVGGKIGYNKNRPDTATTSDKMYPGLELGYGWNFYGWLLGTNAFLDNHTQSVTGKDYGADVKLGYPMDNFMPYAKLGIAATDPGTRAHGGLGIEYKFAPQWGVAAEWTTDSKSANAIKNKNNNISINLNYYFGAIPAAPAFVSAAVTSMAVEKIESIAPPAVAPEPTPEPVVPALAPAPERVAAAPAPVEKKVFIEKPMTIEGASFDIGSAKLKPGAFTQLNEVVSFAAQYPDATLTVTGHTDNRGKEAANQTLSRNRAESVKAYLVGKGVDAKRIVTAGKGSAMPIGDNNSVAGRALNRRVEINSVARVAQ